MSIKTFIRNIINGLGSPATTFIYGEKSWQNLVADNETLPVIFLDEPIRSDDSIKSSGYIAEKYKLGMGFLDKSEIDWTPEQHEVVISAMMELRRELLSALFNSEDVQDISNIKTEEALNVLNCSLSGVLVTFDITIYNTNPVC